MTPFPRVPSAARRRGLQAEPHVGEVCLLCPWGESVCRRSRADLVPLGVKMDLWSRSGVGAVLGVCCLLGLFGHSALSFVLQRGSNDKPIIGIMAQETDFKSFQKFGSSYIGASYVKFIESAGARVVPVSSGFHVVLDIYISLVERSVYEATQGASLQMTILTLFAFLVIDTKSSRMFQKFPEELMHVLVSQPVTSNFHYWSLSVQNFTKNEKLRNFYKILTTNVHNNVEFVSTMEAIKYPIYSVQWHPEKNPYEWTKPKGIPHSRSAMKVTYYTADFFVSEARKNHHHFASKEDETKALIYNFKPVYTEAFSPFEQAYFFD
ncbi:hypothetical protein lerEdw1_008973 [Lerista edwardsae]|nr:hypothetical protein lerEdw1_008973 [Lerista edwardsae]